MTADKVKIELIRLTSDPLLPQHGIIRINGAPSYVTLERPWLKNQSHVSCIPLGVYQCVRVENRRTTGGLDIPMTWEVTKVPGRTGILFHVGNVPRDTHGCILIGRSFSMSMGNPAIINSRQAFEEFVKELKPHQTLELEVKEFR